ncbi:hypothetical protein L9F63_023790, partial [Diploptera punctata]
ENQDKNSVYLCFMVSEEDDGCNLKIPRETGADGGQRSKTQNQNSGPRCNKYECALADIFLAEYGLKTDRDYFVGKILHLGVKLSNKNCTINMQHSPCFSKPEEPSFLLKNDHTMDFKRRFADAFQRSQ